MPTVIARTASTAHGLSLAAGEVHTVRTIAVRWSSVQIVVLDSTRPIYYTVDGSEPGPENPQAFIIPGGVIATETREVPAGRTPLVLKLTSAAPAKFSVQRVVPL